MKFTAQHRHKNHGDDGMKTWTASANGRDYRIIYDRFHPARGFMLAWSYAGRNIWHDLGSHDEGKYAQLAARDARAEFLGTRRAA